MPPTFHTETGRSPLRSVMRWTSRMGIAAVLAPVGLTLAATDLPGPALLAAGSAPTQPPSRRTGPDPSSAGDEDLVVALKQASEPSPFERTSLFRAAPSLDLPDPALRAYRFAESVMRRADPACELDWSLLAAIGDVESDHGRYGGAVVHADGTSIPRIVGPRLDGSNETAAIADTDSGDLDGDGRWDRAVGPMQFIPSTWSVVGSDADGDGRRDPHDLDDAALSAAVYLCAGDEDLSTATGREAAVYRYNHSRSYVDLVLRLAAGYADGTLTLSTPQPTVQPSARPLEMPALRRPVETGAHPAQAPVRAVRRRSTSDRAAASPPETEPPEAESRPARGSDEGDAAGADAPRHDEGATDSSEGAEGTRNTRDTRRTGDTAETGGTEKSPATGGASPGDRNTSSESNIDDSGSAPTGGDEPTEDEVDSADNGDPDSSDPDSSDPGTHDPGSGGSEKGDSTSTRTVSGALERSDSGAWFVGGEPVDLGDQAYLANDALHDFDGEGGIESNLGELETLLGEDVSVVLDEGDLVRQLNDMAYREAG